MYLKEVYIKNFRSIKECKVSLDDFTVFIGENNAGKTTILDAIRIGLNKAINRHSFDEYDFHMDENVNSPKESDGIKIIYHFEEKDEGEWDGYIYMSALSEEIKGKLGDDNFEKSFELELSEGKNFISFIQKAFDWSENRIDQIEDESHKEQAKQEFLIEKKIWTDFERHLSYNYDLDEITVATYMQEFAMISKESEPAKDAVQFLTIHASKGKEFDHVILIGMVNDELPSFQSMKKGIDSVEMEEERRNCFVAITRTQKKLYLTYSAKYYGWRKNPSLFLNEMFF